MKIYLLIVMYIQFCVNIIYFTILNSMLWKVAKIELSRGYLYPTYDNYLSICYTPTNIIMYLSIKDTLFGNTIKSCK